MTPDPRRRRVIIGVDTHKYVHVAVALDNIGGVIGPLLRRRADLAVDITAP